MKRLSNVGRALFTVLFLVSAFALSAQTVTVSGVVRDESGETLISAGVLQSGTHNGTTTNLDGSYAIAVPDNATLEFSYIGYISQVVEVRGRTHIDVVLKADSRILNEVVVIGYGTARKRDLTGAVGSVDSKELKGTPVQNIGQALQGKLAGVQITDNGAPGSDVSIKIRGIGTINNSNPLVVIDGIPTDLGLSSLNMNDVERVDVLKDASATAIYGSRGANGVILVTTRKGSQGSDKIAVNAEFGIQNATNVPELLNAEQYAAYSNDMLSAAGITTNPDWADPSSIGKGTDWLEELLRPGYSRNYTVSVSGGDEKRDYYLSGGLYDLSGIVLNTEYKRVNLQSNNDYTVKPWLKVSSNIHFSADNKNSGSYSISDAMFALPTQSVKNDDGSWSGPEGNSYWYGDIRNPVGTATINTNNTKGYNLLANISADFTILPCLKFKSTFGYDAKWWFYDNFTPAYDWKPIAVTESSRYESSNKSFTYLWDNYFTFNKDFGEHHIDVMGGTSAQNNIYDYISAEKSGFLFDSVSQLGNGSTIKSADGNKSEWALMSLMARANYSYADRYFLTATIRRDGSSRFGENHKYGIFPSFSAAWRISKEPWFPKSETVDDLKLRFGYGVTGNQEIGNYSFASTYNTGVYVFNGNIVNALSSVTMPNENIHWEEVHQTNVGFDLSLFNYRVSLSADAYVKNTEQMLVKAAIPITSGYEDVTTTYTNAGRVSNRGVEMTLTTVNFRGSFNWETSLNVTYNRNRIEDLNSDTPLYLNQYNNSYLTIQKVGWPVNAFYGYVTDGIFQNAEEVSEHALQVSGGTAPGDIRFKDLDNNGVIDENDRTIIGDPNPDWIFAINNKLSWNGFDLCIFIQGVQGNQIYNVNDIVSAGMSAADNQVVKVLGRWQGEGTGNTVPRAVYADPNQNCRASDRFIEDGSYIRLKNISLGYSIPSSLLGKIRVNSVHLSFSMENMLTLSHYTGFDPEVGVDGIDSSRYPISRTASLGININF
ncbi:MAG: TonB-dependent receptor [Bacteroidales bacterium]|jgi:TonB-linked SusC/RagA family outer membrane protein|nr:TonB-dependent receptor [Bacteroidales bacterium]MCI2121674.1 TonB-dependent receptor [Bacteroidales bacterium]MCI2144639.1 TonB-dependent receptor [Bacteroidales bacterium]